MPDTPAIEVEGLGKSFGGRTAVEGVGFSVQAGEAFGLLGPNGAGKTTTLRILAGLLAPDAGRARVAGCAIEPGRPASAALRRSVGLLTEHPGFYDRLDAGENLEHFGALYGVALPEARRRSGRLLERFGLAAHAGKPFAALSRGMKQKLAIARALLHEPQVVLLDEPTVGLDPEATREVRAVVGELRREGRTIVLCTHDLDEVERLCARAAFVSTRLIGIHSVESTRAKRLRVELARPCPAAAAMAGAAVRADGLQLLLELPSDDAAPDAIAALVAAGARITAAVPERDALEAAYLQLLAEARARGLA